jgi:hypothetical protein
MKKKTINTRLLRLQRDRDNGKSGAQRAIDNYFFGGQKPVRKRTRKD